MKPELKKYLIIGLILTIIIFVIGFFIFAGKKQKTQKLAEIEPTEEVIPTVDDSVKVSLELVKKGEVLLSVFNEPKETESIEFEIRYLIINNEATSSDDQTIEQGAIGKCYKTDDKWECGESDNKSGRKIILGTCSSGVCRYHNITGPVKVILRFTGKYGQKIFEKDYHLK